ncbi:MAG: hypothetical protein IT456_20240 [Planctomycetes bacterium]|nr:LamG domain-containing protein [Planctomycetota bacterium]MCC7065149.1 hypothetical protein [Planctomycetota bacterium]
MNCLHRALAGATILALSASISAQDFLLYNFEGPCSAEVVNFATSGLGNGTLTAAFGTGHALGYNGQGLAAGNLSTGARNLVDTLWDPAVAPLTGDLTIAFWARQGQPFTTQLSYLFGMSGSGFRLFTNGAAGTGLYLRSVTTPTTDLLLPGTTADFQALAATSWVHVAVTIDDTNHLATWYIDGAQVHTQSGLGSVAVATGGTLRLGGYGGTAGSAYDLDEVLFSHTLYPAGAIAQLATGTRSGHGSYQSGALSHCGPGDVVLDATGGRPALGNLSYALRITPTSPSLWLLLYGTDRCTIGGVAPLPLDGALLLPLLNGCTVLADPAILLSGFAGPANPASIPLPISPTLSMGANVWCQALTISPPNSAVAMSNGFAVAIGL